MSELPNCKLCGSAPEKLNDGVSEYDQVLFHPPFRSESGRTCPLDNDTAFTLTEWTQLMGAGEPVGVLNVHSYRGMENFDFDYCGNLPDGEYKLYTHPASAVDGAVLRDAARYRWLREQHKKHLGLTICAVGMYELVPWSGDDPDSAIDSAMKGEG